MEVIDDFLPQKLFQVIQDNLMGLEFPWFFNKNVDYDDDFVSCMGRADI